jgi:hypothetical protein
LETERVEGKLCDVVGAVSLEYFELEVVLSLSDYLVLRLSLVLFILQDRLSRRCILRRELGSV